MENIITIDIDSIPQTIRSPIKCVCLIKKIEFYRSSELENEKIKMNLQVNIIVDKFDDDIQNIEFKYDSGNVTINDKINRVLICAGSKRINIDKHNLLGTMTFTILESIPIEHFRQLINDRKFHISCIYVFDIKKTEKGGIIKDDSTTLLSEYKREFNRKIEDISKIDKKILGEISICKMTLLSFSMEELRSLAENYNIEKGNRTKIVLEILKKMFGNDLLEKNRIDEYHLRNIMMRDKRSFWFIRDIENSMPDDLEKSKDKKKAVIFTALPAEYDSVRTHLSDIEEISYKGSIYEKGVFTSEKNLQWDIIIVEVGQGNEGTAIEAERASQYFKPNIVMFVGVAGGVKDVKIGDIVASTKVYEYEYGKAKEYNFSPRPEVYNSTSYLINRARAEARKKDWQKRLKNVPKSEPKVLLGALASGGKVISSTGSEIYKFLESNYSDTLAVEMEGYGFLKAAHVNKLDAIVIRGISDLINDKELTDKLGSQKMASEHASAFAFEILGKYEDKENLEN